MLETNNMFRELLSNHPDISWLCDAEIKAVQQCLLNMMDDIDFVCRKHGLTYWLGGGSMLGAVRHGGFIPWDDDMDIVMPRADYDRLEALILNEFPDRYWVQDVRSDPNYDLSSMKIRRKGTVCLEVLDADIKKAGIFIDIYPLEDTYDSSVLRTLHGYLGEVLLLICSCVRLKQKKNVIMKYLSDSRSIRTVKVKCLIGTLFSFRSLTAWLRTTERVLSRCSNSHSEWVSIPSGRKHYFGEMYHRASFYPPHEIDFDGHRYFIEHDPEEYLTKLYGDYNKVPDVNEREHHGVLKLSLGNGDIVK